MSDYLRRGTPAYRRANLGLFCAGFSSFALLYSVQPLLPLLAQAFRVGPATATLAVSAATTGLAASLLIVGALSDRIGRKSLMALSMFGVVAFNLAAAGASSWPLLLALRFAAGAAMSGVPAVAMAYLAEEVEPDALGAAMGAYIGAAAIGGMAGRLLTGVLADVTGSWRLALTGLALLGLATALAFTRLLPPSRRFTPAPGSHVLEYIRKTLRLFGDAALPWLFVLGFCLMGVYVALFNLITFRLTAAPFRLPNSLLGAIFLVYLAGAPASGAFGRLGDRWGRARVMTLGLTVMLLGLALTLPNLLISIVAGLALVTSGFFGVHALASAWVASRIPAARGQASALYLLFYYLGPSLGGALAGRLWADHGWSGVIAGLAVVLLVPLGILMLSPLRRLAQT